MTTELVVVGIGLVSPLGRGAETHAFLVRAEQGPFAPGGFVTEHGEGVALYACPWLALDRAFPERLAQLGASAVASACEPLTRCSRTPRLAAWVVTPESDDEPARAALCEAVRAHDAKPEVLVGGASVFRALERAQRVLERGEAELALVVAADSLAPLERLAEHRSLAHNPWGPNLLEPSEGAVALLVSTGPVAAELGLESSLRLVHVAAHAEPANDSNDLPIQAEALTRLFRALARAAGAPIRVAFGPTRLDALRRREWDMAQARTAACWDPALAIGCAEQELGHTGELSCALNLALLLACLRHGTMPDAHEPATVARAPCIAWGIDRAGLRGGALVVLDAPRRSREPAARGANGTGQPVRLRPNAPALPGLDASRHAPPGPAVSASSSQAHWSDESREPRLPTESAASDAVRFDPRASTRLSEAELVASQIADCVDRAAMLGRHRLERPTAELAEATARLLAQLDALAVLGATAAQLLDFLDAAGTTDPSVPAAVALALGCLDSPEMDGALLELAEQLPESDETVRAVGSALGWAPLTDPAHRVRELCAADSETARALGLELGGRRGLCPASLIEERVSRGSWLERAAAARASARLDTSATTPRMRDALRDCLDRLGRSESNHDSVARSAGYECARALILQGDRSPLARLRSEPALGRALGEHAARLLALGGQLEDVALLERLLRPLPTSEAILDAVARLGHPGSWAYLVHHLDDPDQADAADRALCTLFGPIAPAHEPVKRERWVGAIAAASFPSSERLRWGARWTPGAIAAECASGRASLVALATWVDELRAERVAIPEPVAALAALV